MLLGPAYAIPKLLAKTGLKLADFDVIELHEAFAGQVRPLLTPPAAVLFIAGAGQPHRSGQPQVLLGQAGLGRRGGSGKVTVILYCTLEIHRWIHQLWCNV